jgi:hypothetical protein
MSTELLTSSQIAMRGTGAICRHPIPPITDPMGKGWRQPNRFDIEIDSTHAVMSRKTFEQLSEYSCSTPSGVYPGKMWRCDLQAYRLPSLPRLPENERHMLKWFGEHPDPKFVSNHWRYILIA